MRKNSLIVFFMLVGLSIFLYPLLANFVSTTGHVKEIAGYDSMVKGLSEEKKKAAEAQAKEHNEKIKQEEQTFIDPFVNGTAGAGTQSYYDALNIGDVMAVLDIPKLDSHLPIYHGSNEKVLSQGVGHLENSALPIGGSGTHAVLTAHRGLPSAKLFRHLDSLVAGDLFFVTVLGQKHAYKVFQTQIVLPNETEWLTQAEDQELVTLLSCEPYMLNTHRLLVTGKRIPYEGAAEKQAKTTQKERQPLFIVLIVGVVILLLLILYYQYSRRRRRA